MISSFSEFIPFIHTDAFVHESAILIGQIEVGAHSSIWPGVVMRGDMGRIKIGENTSIQDGSICHVTEGLSETIVGNRVTVGHRVILHGCTVEDECLIGMGSTLLDNCVIGPGSLIGAGTLVTVGTKIPANSLVMGSPGKVIRSVNEREKNMIAGGWRIYVDYAQRYNNQKKS
jgi:gamma-carbonic anhydrase